MRLSFPVLLVTLAFCCYEVNAEVCPSVLVTLRSFTLGTIPELKSILEKYNPPEAALSAPLEVKECINEISMKDRHYILHILMRVTSTCAS
ncbi:secretoglobin family 1D member 2-like [Rhinolophus ferrumequinum]|uniref:secretoglobin family 1D member 2-like n=1 Tax=Rhinolophus ferrumequinum TaxID=59479 RepID=UPI00140F8717|nr:secretoglobin family 1D member 2-like [Rhinolophus ferrumequinum]